MTVRCPFRFCAALAVLLAGGLGGNAALGITHHVSAGGQHVSPYTNWVMAATNIQDAITSAASGDVVLVSNGVYDTGGRYPPSSIPYMGGRSRVVITNAVSVRSVNGPAHTFIVGGYDAYWGPTRGAYLEDGARLSGFTVTNGLTLSPTSHSGISGCGGGIFLASSDVIVSNCVLTGNDATYEGGGAYAAYGGTLHHCIIRGNTAAEGAGVARGTLYSCAIIGNSARYYAGGALRSTLYNCTVIDNGISFYWLGGGGGTLNCTSYNSVVYYNTAPSENNWSGGTSTYCCTIPLPPGEGNTVAQPRIIDLGNPHLLPQSPCINNGTNYSWMNNAVDIDGEPRTDGWADIGADEFYASGQTGELSAAVTANHSHMACGEPIRFTAQISGRALGYVWDFGDGQNVTNLWGVDHAFATGGAYAVTLTASNSTETVSGMMTVQILQADHFYVRTNGHDAAFGTSWNTAKATIQSAIDVAAPGATIWVSNGTYDAYTPGPYGSVGTCVTIDKPVTVRSVNGPSNTVILARDADMYNPIRCVYLASGSTLSGFTVSNGYTRTTPGYIAEQCGGGVWCESAAAALSNCVIVNNFADGAGGGIFRGTAYGCDISRNAASDGGGTCSSRLYRCTLSCNDSRYGEGGGACGGQLLDCTLVGNNAGYGGAVSRAGADRCTFRNNTSYWGCVYYSDLRSCVLVSNVGHYAAGAARSWLVGCTVVGNTSYNYGGVMLSTAENCIVYFNDGANFDSLSSIRFTCTSPLPPGDGNMTNEPGILSIDVPRLELDSPCIDAGTLVSLDSDIEGTPRPLDGDDDGTAAFDMGAYEYVHPAADTDLDGMPDSWEIPQGLDPRDDGSVSVDNGAAGDPDSDRMSNGEEWIAGTTPTDANSVFTVDLNADSESQTNFMITIPTAPARKYTIEFTDLTLSNDTTWSTFANTNDGFGTWIETSTVSTTHTFVDDFGADSTMVSPGSGHRSYRVRVSVP